MAITKNAYVDRADPVASGSVQVRTRTDEVENGVVISSAFHRHVVSPGDDYSGEDDLVRTVCAEVHTPEVIAAYQASIAA